mgnify:FL=1
MREIKADEGIPGVLADGLWILGHPFFNLYLVRGTAGAALIEAGVSATADLVIGQLERLGVRPDVLVVTHPHGDHVNGLPALREAFPDARVIAGPGAEAFCAHPRTGALLVNDDRYMSAFLAARGVAVRRPPLAAPPSLAGSEVMHDGDVLDLGGLTLRFLEAKGHAPGNLAVHVPERAALIASDSLGYRYLDRGFFPIFFTGYADYLATIDRMAALEPRILGLAHQGALTGAAATAAFGAARAGAVAVRDRLRRDERPDEAVVSDLFTEFYRDELALYSEENILLCCALLLRRSREGS